MKRLIYIYLLLFIALDVFLGFTLKYLGLASVMPVHPGQMIRGVLLFLLLYSLVINQVKKPTKTSLLVIFTVLYLIGLSVILGAQQNDFGSVIAELYNVSKLFFVVLLSYFIGENRYYYNNLKIEKVFNINFIVFSINILFGFLTGIGLSTYEMVDNSSKGFLDGGNAASILALVFFIYYLFNWGKGSWNKFFVLLSFFVIYMVATKVIFITPLIIGLFIFFKVKWSLSKLLISGIFVFPILIYLIVLFKPLAVEIYENRYLHMLNRSGIFTSDISYNVTDAFLAYRRIAYSIDQTNYQFDNKIFLFTGLGREGQKEYWESKNAGMDFAAMDFFDTLFQYGLIGVLLIYSLFLISLRRAWKNGLSNPFSITLFIIYSYSFFGGYVLFSATAGTMLATLVGLHLLTDSKRTHNEFGEIKLKY